MISQSLLSSLQSTIDTIAKARDESKHDDGHSNDLDVNERLSNLERSLVHVLARLDKAEKAKSKQSNNANVDEILATTERMLREIFLEMIKQQTTIEKYKQENDALKERLQIKAKDVTFSHTTTSIPPRTTTTQPATSFNPSAPIKITTNHTLNPTPTTTTTSKGPNKRPSPVPKAVPPPKQTTATKGRTRASSFGEGENSYFQDGADSSEEIETEKPDTPPAAQAAQSTVQKPLPVDFPVGYNPNRGRRFSVAGESLNPTSDLGSGPRTIIKKSEEAKRRIRSVITNNILFKNLDEDQLEDLVDEMFEVRLRPEEVVIRQGDDGNNFYIVDSGELYVLYRDVVVATIGSGKSFGEIALMYNCPRTATVRAKSECILWGMSRGTFRRSLMVYAIRKRELYESFLARVPLLETLLPYERSIIADALEPRTYHNGDLLIRQGERGDNFFILERGKVVVTKGDPPVEVKVYGEGDYFGELALLNDQPRAANVKAVGVVRVLTLSREDFANLMGPCEEILKRNMILYQQVQSDNPSPPSSSQKPRELNAIVQEFVSDEASYLRNLQVLVTDFLVPLRKSVEGNGSATVNAEEVASLFSNVEMLLNIHNQFREQAGRLPSLPPSEIAKVFSKLHPGLKFYKEYVRNWPTANEIWERRKNDEQINLFLKTPSRAPHDFYSLLRAPVDRVPAMVTFLKEVHAATNDKDLPEVANLLASLTQ